jgi:RNA polymerase sigma factor (sigma-70 family)
MNEMDCASISKANAKKIADHIRIEESAHTSGPIGQLNDCLRKELICWAVITYKSRYPDTSLIEFTADQAFTEALLKLHNDALSGNISDRGASIKTVLFTFFKFKLMELLQKENRRMEKERRYFATNDPANESEDRMDQNDITYALLRRALANMKAKDQEIITQRHLHQETPESIAEKLNISTEAVNNKLYRSMKRLKKEIKKLKSHGNI